VRILTGNPIFSYSLTGNINLASVFSLLQAAEKANYIMGAGTYPGSDTTYN
jgi:hypothetical protein